MLKNKWRQLMKDSQGMTLIEIMVVVAIIGMITAMVTVTVIGFLEEARIETTRNQINTIESALDQFKRRHGFYPSTEQGLEALVEAPSVGRVPKNYPEDGYLKSFPKDAWGNDFVYYHPGVSGHKIEIISLGADAEEGGEDESADITNYDDEQRDQG